MILNLEPLRWIRENRQQVDVSVQQHLIDKMRWTQYVPCFLHRVIAKLLYYVMRMPVIVEFESTFSAQSEAIVSRWRSHNIKVKRQFSHYPGCATRLTLRKMNHLLRQDGVRKVYLDRKVTALLDKATPSVNSHRLWNASITGQGVGIAVIDTGVAPHPDLTEPRNRIVAFKDFIGHETEPYDDNGHGTHCAGDAAGNGTASDGKYRGPAYEADIIGVKVLDKQGSGQLSDLIAGVDWCIENRDTYNIRILSLSVGSPASGRVKDDPLARAVRQAWTSGLVVVAAAGNSGPDGGTITSPGVVPEIITVGASDDHDTIRSDDDEVASFSSRGPTPEGVPKPDVVAPGTHVVSLRANGSYLDKTNIESVVNDDYVSLSGTSMATPIVAGIAAQLIQKDADLTPDDVKTALTETATSLGDEPNAEGHGLVNATAALDALANR